MAGQNDIKEKAETELARKRWSALSETQKGEGSAGARPALDPNLAKTEMSSSKLDSCLNPPPEEQELPIMVYDPTLSGQTWSSCPEAEMVETGLLRRTILKIIIGEIKNIV